MDRVRQRRNKLIYSHCEFHDVRSIDSTVSSPYYTVLDHIDLCLARLDNDEAARRRFRFGFLLQTLQCTASVTSFLHQKFVSSNHNVLQMLFVSTEVWQRRNCKSRFRFGLIHSRATQRTIVCGLLTSFMPLRLVCVSCDVVRVLFV